MKIFLLLLSAFLLPGVCRAQKNPDLLMGSVVKSDKWKMDRTNNIETFTGNVSFKNPSYVLKADNAVYNRDKSVWNLSGSVYTLRYLKDLSQVEMRCDRARYLELDEEAYLERGALPVRFKYLGADGRILNGRSARAWGENKKALMHFNGAFALTTENLELYSEQALYDNAQSTFLLYDSTSPHPETLPAALGKREGYDFAIAAETIKFFKDSRDIKFYNRVSGWTKDVPRPAAADSRKKL
ncbi:MAG TPA: LptA/OstA family protein [Elusimicrobiales bacterium]|nr:LptA/OstA family protein [Elusimicrobiales bacterium]